jgi:threonine/homoserine/homoserine lactone efflux protein
MTLAALTLALLALLATPGPTNSLLAVAGAERGFRAALPLVPVELCAYLAIVVPLVIWGNPLINGLPILRPLVTGCAAVWVAWLALRLWQRPASFDPASRVGAVQVGVTTLLNPKALIFGLVLVPEAASPATGLAVFAGLVPAVSLLWIGLGAGALSRAGRWVSRGAALWMAGLSLLLVAKALVH